MQIGKWINLTHLGVIICDGRAGSSSFSQGWIMIPCWYFSSWKTIVVNICESWDEWDLSALFSGKLKERKIIKVKKSNRRTSLVIQWWGHCVSSVGGTGSIPDPGTKIPHAMQHGQKWINQKPSLYWPLSSSNSDPNATNTSKAARVTVVSSFLILRPLAGTAACRIGEFVQITCPPSKGKGVSFRFPMETPWQQTLWQRKLRVFKSNNNLP